MPTFIVFAATCSLFLASCAGYDNSSSTLFLGDINEYLRAHPDLKVVGELERKPGLNKHAITYQIGARSNGDRLVATLGESNSWSHPRDVLYQLKYPANPNPAGIVTYVQVDVRQSNAVGRAYVLSGGFCQRHIIVAVEAKGVTYFEQSSHIYALP